MKGFKKYRVGLSYYLYKRLGYYKGLGYFQSSPYLYCHKLRQLQYIMERSLKMLQSFVSQKQDSVR